MKIIKDNKITIDLGDDDEWDKITDISEPSIIIYETIKPSVFYKVFRQIENTRLSKPKLFVKKINIESYPEVVTDGKNIVEKYNPSIVYDDEYSPVGIIYIDKYKKKKQNETVEDMIENLMKENRLEVEPIDDE